jgi:hypothetical protein
VRAEVDVDAWAGVINFTGDRPSVQAVAEWLKRQRDRVFSIPEDSDDDASPLTRVQLTAGQKRARQTHWRILALTDGEPVNRCVPENLRTREVSEKNVIRSDTFLGRGYSGASRFTGSPSGLEGEL